MRFRASVYVVQRSVSKGGKSKSVQFSQRDLTPIEKENITIPLAKCRFSGAANTDKIRKFSTEKRQKSDKNAEPKGRFWFTAFFPFTVGSVEKAETGQRKSGYAAFCAAFPMSTLFVLSISR